MSCVPKLSDGRLWWAVEGDFELAKLDQIKFGKRVDGPTVAVVNGMSFAFQLRLFPNGAKYSDGEEERDHMGAGVALVDGPIDRMADFKYAVKVYMADGSLSLSALRPTLVTMDKDGWLNAKALPRATSQLKPYVLCEAGSEFVRVRVELGVPPAAFDALALLPPPAPRQDLPQRLERWCHGGHGVVSLVSGDGGPSLLVYKDLLTETSDVFERMLGADMQEGSSGRVQMDDLCAESLDEFNSFITHGATRASRLRTHVLKLLTVAQGYFLPELKRLCERTVVEKMQEKKLTGDFLNLVQAAQTYELRVAMNVGLCRLIKAYPQLSAEELARFNSPEFAGVRERFMKLSCQALGAINA